MAERKGINWGDVGAFGAGAIDELLFGIPEYAVKNLGGREMADKYIKEHEKAYRTGETAGTVGSIFLPLPGAALVKGGSLAAKGLRGVRAADKAADALKLLKGAGEAKKALGLAELAGRGALSGGLESAVRGVTSEKKPSDILKDIQTGAMFGGAGGAIGGTIAKKLKPTTEKLAETTAQQYLKGRGISSKSLKKAFLESMPKGAGDQYKVQKAGDYLRDVADFTKTIPRGKGAIEELSAQSEDAWKVLDKAWQSKYGKATARDVIMNIISPEDQAKLVEEYGEDAANEAIRTILNTAGSKKGLVGMKKYLESQFNAARTNPRFAENVDLSGAMQDLASGLKNRLDDIAMSAADEMGQGVDLAKLKKTYKLSKPLQKADILETLSTPAAGGGSPTMEKTAVLSALGGLAPGLAGSGVGAALGATGPEEGTEKLKKIALASLAGAALTKGVSAAGSRGIGALDTIVAKLASKVPKEIPEALVKAAATSGGMAGSVISRQAINEAQPETTEQAQAAEVGAEAGQKSPKYQDLVLQKIKDYAASKGVKENDPEFLQFVQQVYQMTDGLAPEKIGGILFQDEGERAAYGRALSVSRSLSEVMPTATAVKPGLLQGETEEARIQREAAADQLASIVGEVAKDRGSEAAAKKAITRILSGGEDPERKQELIGMVLAQYGVDLDMLKNLGVS